MMNNDRLDYLNLFLDDVPLLDVRAQVEFNNGAFPYASNIPVLNDDERARVGTCYKRYGQESAIKLGYELVSSELREQRIQAWADYVRNNPHGVLYCFRGGMRSRLSQQALRETLGIHYPLVTGGYKGMRRFLIDQLETLSAKAKTVVVAGATGCGKTEVIQNVTGGVDLEGCANHRGSSFGKLPDGQPSQIDFENRVSIGFLKQYHRVGGTLYLEDEGKLIGQCVLTPAVQNTIARSQIVRVVDTLEGRIERTIRGYVSDVFSRLQSLGHSEEEAYIKLGAYLTAGLTGIKKRLGGLRYQELFGLLGSALQQQRDTGKLDGYRELISRLLTEYYDPMYEFQQKRKRRELLFQGDPQEVVEWARENN